MAENAENNSAVDETPISPIESQSSLEKHLQTRPDPQDLKNRGILYDTNVAPSLQPAALELERQRAADALKRGLGKRPERDQLVDRNILPDSTAAPALQEKQRELSKHMRKDSLERQLQARPKPEDLIKEGILEANEDPTKE